MSLKTQENRSTIFFVHFSIQNKAQNLPTSKFENPSFWKLTQTVYIQLRYFVIVLNFFLVFFDKEAKHESSFILIIGYWKSPLFYRGKCFATGSWHYTLNLSVYWRVMATLIRVLGKCLGNERHYCGCREIRRRVAYMWFTLFVILFSFLNWLN